MRLAIGAGGGNYTPSMTAARPRVLLVDDEPSIVKMVGKRLEVEGFDVLVAVDGQEALEKATTQNPDLIILDLMLPQRNGFEVCSTLKQDARYRHIPIIIFTGKGQAGDDQRGQECGADAFVTKSSGKGVLIEQVRTLLNKQRVQ